ncbi:TetR/AcrR family transcriptional regulator [Antrihabitans sp. NCIMB 15449]|uniref:TetR/AcrR family transcriptional regulator n=1 Tax=Antrihabitans spumae TaxID=3373370 RepID=A0ABW7JNM6_9NOCA
MTTPRRRGRPPASDSDAGDTRRRIVEAALELFAEKGFHGTGVAEIGTRADVQRGALYYHIKSKEELLWEVLRDYVTELLVEAEAIVAAGNEPTLTLGNLIRSHVTRIVEHSREVRIQLRDGTSLDDTHAAELQELRDRVQQCWQQVLDQGYADGAFASADHVITNSLLGTVNMVSFWYRPNGGRTPDEIGDVLAALLLDGVKTTR